mgnify:CR=1 FL=1
MTACPSDAADFASLLRFSHALRGDGRLDEALACHARVTALHPRRADGWFDLGLAEQARGDLGAAARVHNGGRSTLVGSPAYTAPEVVAIAHLGLDISSGATYNFSVDVWSAGIVLVEMLTAGNTLPFPSAPRDPSAQPAAICFKPPNLEPSLPPSPPMQPQCHGSQP